MLGDSVQFDCLLCLHSLSFLVQLYDSGGLLSSQTCNKERGGTPLDNAGAVKWDETMADAIKWEA